MRAHSIRRTICLVVAAALLWQAPLAGAARAGMVSTETVLRTEGAAPSRSDEALRDRLRAFLQRRDVRAELEALGVDPAEAEARVASLSDAEVAALVTRIDSQPAGGLTEAGVLFILGLAVVGAVAILVGIIWGLSHLGESPKGGPESVPRSPPTDPKPTATPPAGS